MTKHEGSLSSEQAREALAEVTRSKEKVANAFRAPKFLAMVGSLGYASIVFGYGMTEHENLWALAMWGGAIVFFVSAALILYTGYIFGAKPNIIPKNRNMLIFNIAAAIAFALLISMGRTLRLEGWDYAPHAAAILSATLMYWIQLRFPTDEIIK